MKRNLVAQDIEDWEPLLAWLKAKEGLVGPAQASIRCPTAPASTPLPETA